MRDNSDRSDSVLDQHSTFRKHVFPVVLSAFVFAVAILCLLEKMHRMRLSVYSTACFQNSYEIAHHLRAYKERHGHYPPPVVYDENGKPKHSWRVLILQNFQPFYSAYDFDEPWDGPNNRKLSDQMPQFFKCAMDQSSPPTHTSFLAITGIGTAFPTDNSGHDENVKDYPGNKIIVAEVSNSGVHWMDPKDLEVETMSFRVNDESRPSIRSHHEKGAAVIYGDLDHGWLDLVASPDQVKNMVMITKGIISRNAP